MNLPEDSLFTSMKADFHMTRLELMDTLKRGKDVLVHRIGEQKGGRMLLGLCLTVT